MSRPGALAVSLSGSSLLCVRARHSSDTLCVAAGLSLGARRSLTRVRAGVAARRSLYPSWAVSAGPGALCQGRKLFVMGPSVSGPAVAVSGPSAL